MYMLRTTDGQGKPVLHNDPQLQSTLTQIYGLVSDPAWRKLPDLEVLINADDYGRVSATTRPVLLPYIASPAALVTPARVRATPAFGRRCCRYSRSQRSAARVRTSSTPTPPLPPPPPLPQALALALAPQPLALTLPLTRCGPPLPRRSLRDRGQERHRHRQRQR
jgi:hypothetical protein